ncbi:MAG: hypothetical protein CR988_06780 [Treponema sp.]|nr:MAG: hypothetical protein CR988_06780 [Treponema sp.]
MKILVFYDNKKDFNIKVIQNILGKHKFDVALYSSEDLQDKNPVDIFSDVTHVLFISKKFVEAVPEFIFYSGYAFGKKLPVLLLSDTSTTVLPAYYANFIIKLDISTIDSYFEKEKNLYETTRKKELAREKLLEKGYSCFDANFVSVVEADNIEIAKMFLEAGFSPSTTNAYGTPVLSLAVRNDLFKMAKFLVTHGADVDMISEDRNYSALMDATQVGDYKNAKMLLANGANPNLHSKDRQTALILAVGRNDPKLVKLLVDYGADPEYKDALGMSALKYAKLFNNAKILKILNA